MFRRGYENGEQTIEIYEGRVDLVVYHEEKPNFYFYRFQSEDILGEKLGRNVNLLFKHEVEPFLASRGMTYGGLIEELLEKAWSTNMAQRDDL